MPRALRYCSWDFEKYSPAGARALLSKDHDSSKLKLSFIYIGQHLPPGFIYNSPDENCRTIVNRSYYNLFLPFILKRIIKLNSIR